jgi:hypothetical protein
VAYNFGAARFHAQVAEHRVRFAGEGGGGVMRRGRAGQGKVFRNTCGGLQLLFLCVSKVIVF